MDPDEVRELLDRFAADIGRVVPLIALWAHGSLALGDFQPGRSDLDLVALVGVTISDTQRQELKVTHEKLIKQVPLAGTLHCSYVVQSELADAGRRAGEPWQKDEEAGSQRVGEEDEGLDRSTG